MKSPYHEGYDAGVEFAERRIMRLIEEAVEIGEQHKPRDEYERHQRDGGLELLALLTYRIEGKTKEEAAVQLTRDISEAWVKKNLIKEEVKK